MESNQIKEIPAILGEGKPICRSVIKFENLNVTNVGSLVDGWIHVNQTTKNKFIRMVKNLLLYLRYSQALLPNSQPCHDQKSRLMDMADIISQFDRKADLLLRGVQLESCSASDPALVNKYGDAVVKCLKTLNESADKMHLDITPEALAEEIRPAFDAAVKTLSLCYNTAIISSRDVSITGSNMKFFSKKEWEDPSFARLKREELSAIIFSLDRYLDTAVIQDSYCSKEVFELLKDEIDIFMALYRINGDDRVSSYGNYNLLQTQFNLINNLAILLIAQRSRNKSIVQLCEELEGSTEPPSKAEMLTQIKKFDFSIQDLLTNEKGIHIEERIEKCKRIRHRNQLELRTFLWNFFSRS